MLDLIQQYGNAEHSQDDGQALYLYNLIKEKILLIEGEAVEKYKASLVPVAWTITNPDGVTVNEVPDYAFYSYEDAKNWRDMQCYDACNVVPVYALKETDK